MNILKLAFFVLLLNFTVAFLNDMAFVNTSEFEQSTTEWDLETEYAAEDFLVAGFATSALAMLGLGDIAISVGLFIGLIERSLFYIPHIMTMHHFPTALVGMVSAIHWFIFLAAMVQIVRGGTGWTGFD